MTYGDLRKLRKLQATNPEAAEDYFDELVRGVVDGGIDDLPFLEAKAVLRPARHALTGGHGGKGPTGRAVLAGLRRGRIEHDSYESLMLIREYHCTPLELDRQPLDVVLDHIQCLQAEVTNQKLEQRRAKLRRK